MAPRESLEGGEEDIILGLPNGKRLVRIWERNKQGKKRKELSWASATARWRNEEERGCGSFYTWGVWGPQLITLNGLENGLFGPQMDLTKKTKMTLIKSSFQKVYFLHGSGISKFELIFQCEKVVLPLGLKNWFSRLQMEIRWTRKLLGIIWHIKRN